MISKLENIKYEIEQAIACLIEEMGTESLLEKACAYALQTNGKRFRPIIVYLIAQALNSPFDVMPSALASEVLHTASLIADDMPCMDNENERRNKATLHKVYGESIALLASYTLISKGYELVCDNSNKVASQGFKEPEKACVVAIKQMSQAAGLSGATNGQFLDLYPPDNSIETIIKIMEQKTITLFEMSFVLGWIFGGGNLDQLEDLKKCAYHFGLAFQIADDLQDVQQDSKEINIAVKLGVTEAKSWFYKEINLFTEKMKSLNLLTESFESITKYLLNSVKRGS